MGMDRRNLPRDLDRELGVARQEMRDVITVRLQGESARER
jgi:hypothetical protein